MAVIEPVAHAQSEEILAAVHALGVEPQFFQRGARQFGEFHGKEAIAIERMIFKKGSLNDLGLAKIRRVSLEAIFRDL